MKHLATLVLMLILMGQRWIPVDGPSEVRPGCATDVWTQDRGWRCEGEHAVSYQPVWVIGEVIPELYACQKLQKNRRGLDIGINELGPCSVERFTIPVPNTPLKLMTVEEADKANRDLMK